VARAVARLGYLGVRDAAGLLRRERRLVALMRRAERVLGVRRARARAARAGAGR
jgi:hypothetical protein